MARKKEITPGDRDETARKKKLLSRVHEAHRRFTDDGQEAKNRRRAIDDMRFVHVPGAQWDEAQKRRRGKRPCYEFNKLAVTIKRVINDMRANRAAGKVRAFEDGDVDTADVFEGLIRNITNASNFDAVQDYAAGYQVAGGLGAWRVETAYSDDTTFEQEIRITEVSNPFCLYMDEDEAVFVDVITNAEYERRWPKAERMDFDAAEFNLTTEWTTENETRICEYWYKEPVTREVVLLEDGRTVYAEEAPPDAQIMRRRLVRSHKVRMCIASGSAILEEAEWAGKMIPFIQVYGERVNIEGRAYWYGLARNAKDAQRSYNVSRTSVTETIAMAPLAKSWATPTQASGHAERWAIAHDENLPYLLYNADPKAPGPPVRMGGADVPVALIQESQIASEEIKAVTGIFDQSLGSGPASQSGVAVRARQSQGELATYNFKANMAEGVRKTWEILVDLIPRIYTADRSIRILGADGAEKFARINSLQLDPRTAQMVPVNDLTRGKYDVAITVGPSFSTQRQEAADVYMQLANGNPQLMQLIGDLVFQSLDYPKSDQIAERMRLLLPPQVQQQIASGKPIPPEIQAAMQQVEFAQQQVAQQSQQLQQAQAQAQSVQAEIGQDKAQADKAKADVQVAIANLKAQEADLARQVAEFKALIAEQSAEAAKQGSAIDVQAAVQKAAEQEALSAQIIEALSAINARTEQVLAAHADQIAQIPATVAQAIPQAPRRTKRTVSVSRQQDGSLVGGVRQTYEDGSIEDRPVSVRRVNGQLIGEVGDAGTIQ